MLYIFEFLTVWIHYSIFLCLLCKNPFTHKTHENAVWIHYGFLLCLFRMNPFTHKSQEKRTYHFDFFFSIYFSMTTYYILNII